MRKLALIILTSLLFAGCASDGVAPVVERSTLPLAQEERVAPEYVVQGGDTLYGIAFRRNLDYRQIAAWNGLSPPYLLRPGQRLVLHPNGVVSHTPTAPPLGHDQTIAVAPVREEAAVVPLAPEPLPPPVATPRPAPAPVATPTPRPSPLPRTVERTTTTTVTTTTTTTPVRGEPTTRVTQSTTREVVPAPTPTPAPMPVVKPTPTPAPIAAAIEPGPTQRVAGIGWRWPASGRVVAGYDAADPARQGLDIAGNAGQSVLAAADGEVVYSGNGLIGYGELIIIKHDAEFLSAYGYNRKRLVAEGQRVRAGQPIAEMGRSPAAVDALHFEIRRGGKPVDPSRYLPRR